MPRIWLIDDMPNVHAVTEATVHQIGGWEFRGFFSGIDAVKSLRRCEPGLAPQVILIDYYIGHERGDRIAPLLRSAEPADARPVLVGFSSVRSGSEAIVAAGAEVIVRKHQDDRGINPSLAEYLRNWPT